VLIQRISGWGWPLLAINEVQRSLEDVYLTIVGQTHRERMSSPLEQPNAAAVAEVAL